MIWKGLDLKGLNPFRQLSESNYAAFCDALI